MSEQPAPTRSCPTCGNTIPVTARYCPNCGTRLNPTEEFTTDDFEDALADVLDAPVEEPDSEPVPTTVSPDDPTATLPPVTATTPGQQTPSDQQEEWTASAKNWGEPPSDAGTWATATPVAAPAKPRGNRTLWIILAIFGFIVFCCCGSFFVLLLVAETDTAFQEEVSLLAPLLIG